MSVMAEGEVPGEMGELKITLSPAHLNTALGTCGVRAVFLVLVEGSLVMFAGTIVGLCARGESGGGGKQFEDGLSVMTTRERKRCIDRLEEIIW